MVALHVPSVTLTATSPAPAIPLAVTDYALFAAPFVGIALVFLLVTRSVVMLDEGQYHVVMDGGDVVEVLDEGFYVRSPLHTGWSIDTSPLNFRLAGGVVETSDGVAVSGDVSGRFRIVDPERLATVTREFPGDVKRRIDEAYVTQLERLSWDDEDDPQRTLEQRCRSEVERALERWGVELEALTVDRLERVE